MLFHGLLCLQVQKWALFCGISGHHPSGMSAPSKITENPIVDWYPPTDVSFQLTQQTRRHKKKLESVLGFKEANSDSFRTTLKTLAYTRQWERRKVVNPGVTILDQLRTPSYPISHSAMKMSRITKTQTLLETKTLITPYLQRTNPSRKMQVCCARWWGKMGRFSSGINILCHKLDLSYLPTATFRTWITTTKLKPPYAPMPNNEPLHLWQPRHPLWRRAPVHRRRITSLGEGGRWKVTIKYSITNWQERTASVRLLLKR